MSEIIETRNCEAFGREQLQRNEAGEPTAFVGYGAVYYRSDDPRTEFRFDERRSERIEQGAFNGIEGQPREIISTYNHDESRILGRQSNNTLEVRADEKGLYYSVPYDASDPDHIYASRKIQNGMVAGSSFVFQVAERGAELRREGEGVVRWLKAVEVREVGPVVRPAYHGAGAAMRSGEFTDDLVAAFDKFELTLSKEEAAQARSELWDTLKDSR